MKLEEEEDREANKIVDIQSFKSSIIFINCLKEKYRANTLYLDQM